MRSYHSRTILTTRPVGAIANVNFPNHNHAGAEPLALYPVPSHYRCARGSRHNLARGIRLCRPEGFRLVLGDDMYVEVALSNSVDRSEYPAVLETNPCLGSCDHDASKVANQQGEFPVELGCLLRFALKELFH